MKSTELVIPPIPKTDPVPPEPQTTKSTELVKPPIPTTEPVPPEPQTTKSTELVRPPIATTDPVPPEPQTTKSTKIVKSPVTRTEPTTREVLTKMSTEGVRRSTPTAEIPTTSSAKDELCPSQIEAAVILASGWLALFSGNSFYLISKRGKEYGPIRVQDYFPGLRGRVTAAYRREDNCVVLFAGNRFVAT